jgi:ABC-type transporter Mla maintaining outer membrane lipid asymmetry ATPase subunit MlaF
MPSGGSIIGTLKRATGFGISKDQHTKLLPKLREQLNETEKEIKQKKKVLNKVNEDVILLKAKAVQIEKQIEESTKVSKSWLGGSKGGSKSRSKRSKRNITRKRG